MASFSIGAAWDEMVAFVRRENGIVTPVAMATFGIGAILLSLAFPEGLAPAAADSTGRALLILPAMLALMFGNLTLSILALSPGLSVADALRRATMRIPTMIVAGLLLGGILLAAILVLSVVIIPFAGNVATATAIVAPLVAILFIALAVPSLLLSPIVAMEAVSPMGALRRVAALVRGNFARLCAVLAVVILVMMTVSLIATVVVMVVTKLLALLFGQAALVALIGDIVLAAISALLSLAVALYVAFVYRQLAS